MISVYELYLSVGDYGQKYQSGLSIADTFNRNLKQVQIEIISDFAPHYWGNDAVRNLLRNWVRRIGDVSDQYGVITIPGREGVQEETTELYMKPLALGVCDENGVPQYEISPIMENEIYITLRIPQRRASLAKKRVYYLDYDNRIQLYPQAEIPFEMFYMIYPLEARVGFRYTIVDGEDIQIPDENTTIDLSWDDNAANLFLYKMLQKYGAENREQVVAAYGAYGVDMTLKMAQP